MYYFLKSRSSVQYLRRCPLLYLPGCACSSALCTPLLPRASLTGALWTALFFPFAFSLQYFLFHAISALYVVIAQWALVTRKHRDDISFGRLCYLDFLAHVLSAYTPNSTSRVRGFKEWTLLHSVENVPGGVLYMHCPELFTL